SRPRAGTWGTSLGRPSGASPRPWGGCVKARANRGSSPPDLGSRRVAHRRDARARRLLLLGAPRRGGGVLTSARLVRAHGGPAGAAAPLRRRRAAPRRDPGARRPACHGTHAARLGARARGLAGGPGVAGGWGAARDPGRSDRRPGPRDACRVSPRSDADGRPARVRAVRGAAVSLFRLVGGAVPRRAAVRAPRAVRRRVVQRRADRAVGHGALRPRPQRNASGGAGGGGVRRDRSTRRIDLVCRTATLDCRRDHGLVHPHDLTASPPGVLHVPPALSASSRPGYNSPRANPLPLAAWPA